MRIDGKKNFVQGNFIGTDKSGQKKSPNTWGIVVFQGSGNTIGGTKPGEGNLVSGNKLDGIFVRFSGNQSIQGNLVGTTADGKGNLGNGMHGILLESSNNLVGGLKTRARNTIAFNDGAGIVDASGIIGGQNRIISNSIHSNGGLGIDLNDDQVSSNDAKDNDKSLQNFPEILSATSSARTEKTIIAFELKSTPGQSFTIQFSQNTTCDIDSRPKNPRCSPDDLPACGWGEGAELLGTVLEVKTGDPSGVAAKLVTFARRVAVGDFITATATSLTDLNAATPGTSEFSKCVQVEEDKDGDGCPARLDEMDDDPRQCSTIIHGYEISIKANEGPLTVGSLRASLGRVKDDLLLPVDLLDLKVQVPSQSPSSQNVLQGASTTVTLFLPPGLKVDTYYNFGPTPDDPEPHFYEFLFDGVTGAEIFEDRIVLHFVDGARGDHDLTVNGEIVTRGGPATNASLLLFPFNRTVAGSFTGFAVSNFSERNAVVEFDAFDSEGEFSLFLNNPAVFAVSESKQVARLGAQIFEADESADAVSWVRAKTDNPELGSFFQIGGGARLDGSVAFTEQSKTMYFTRVFEGPTSFRGQPASTLLSIANPNSEEITVKLTLLGNPEGGSPAEWIESSGSLAPVQIRTIAPQGALFATVSEIFEEELNVASAFIEVEVTEGEGAVGFELIELQSQDTVIGLNASFGSTQTESFSAQLASVADSVFTNLKVLNTSEENRSLTLTAVAEDGSDLAAPVQMNLAAGEFLEQDAGEVFAFEGDAVGSLRIVADGEGVIGDIIFGDPVAFNFAASLPLQTETLTEAVFSQVADLPGLFFTGLAFYNPGTVDAEVTIEIIAANGELVGQATRTLEAGKRLSELTSQLVPESAGQAGGYVLIRSDQPLIAQIIFGGLGPGGITLFSAVPPTVIQ